MCPQGSAFEGPPQSCELARIRAAARAQRQVHNRRPFLGTSTTRSQRLFSHPHELQAAHSIRLEHLQTGRPAPASLPVEPGLPHVPIVDLLLSCALDTPMSGLPDDRTILGLPVLPDVESSPFPLPPGHASEKQ